MKAILLSLALALAASTAQAHCFPSDALNGTGGPAKMKLLGDGVIYAWTCPDGNNVAFGAPFAWSPKMPTNPQDMRMEMSRLWMMVGYAREPNFRREEAQALLK